MPINSTKTTGFRAGEPATDGTDRLGVLRRDIDLQMETLRFISNTDVREEAGDLLERLCQHYADETERMEAGLNRPAWEVPLDGISFVPALDPNEARKKLRMAQTEMNALAKTKKELETFVTPSDSNSESDLARGLAAMERNLQAAEALYLDVTAEYQDALLHELMTGGNSDTTASTYDLMQQHAAPRGKSLRN